MKLGAFQSFHGDVFLQVQAYTSRSLLSIVILLLLINPFTPKILVSFFLPR